MKYCIPTTIPNIMEIIETDSNKNIDNIIDGCLKFFGISMAMMKNKTRRKEIAECRQWISYMLRQKTTISLLRIASILNHSDHTTVIHSINKIGKKIKTEESYRIEYLALKNYLKI